jgi:hypothetical protein
MKNKTLLVALALASANLTGCSVIRGIFKAGVWSGVIVVLLIVGMIAGVTMLLRSRT